MSKIVEEARRQIRQAVIEAAGCAVASGELPPEPMCDFIIEVPADRKNGDYSTNAAMVNARAMRNAPQKIAAALVERFEFGDLPVERCEIAGPGFLNLTVSTDWLNSQLLGLSASRHLGIPQLFSQGRGRRGNTRQPRRHLQATNP